MLRYICVCVCPSSVYEELLLERTLDVCQGGVDVIIDFVSSPRTVKRDLKVLREVRVILGSYHPYLREAS